MANFRGDKLNDVNLLATTYTSGVTKDGKRRFFDVQVDARDSRGPKQTNLHLINETRKDKEGNFLKPNHGTAYSETQTAKIIEAAGDNTTPLRNKDGKEVGTVYAIKADLMSSKGTPGLIINTKKDIQASDFGVDENTINNQFASIRKAKADKEAAEAAAKEAETAEPAVEQQELPLGEPSL